MFEFFLSRAIFNVGTESRNCEQCAQFTVEATVGFFHRYMQENLFKINKQFRKLLDALLTYDSNRLKAFVFLFPFFSLNVETSGNNNKSTRARG